MWLNTLWNEVFLAVANVDVLGKGRRGFFSCEVHPFVIVLFAAQFLVCCVVFAADGFDADSLFDVVDGREETDVVDGGSACGGCEAENRGTLADGEGVARVVGVESCGGHVPNESGAF